VCCSYSDLNFGVTFLEHSVVLCECCQDALLSVWQIVCVQIRWFLCLYFVRSMQ